MASQQVTVGKMVLRATEDRLHDYDARLRAAWEVRSFRQKLFQAALPGISIDTDGVWSSRREIAGIWDDYSHRMDERYGKVILP